MIELDQTISVFNAPRALLATLGSWWTDTYTGASEVESIVRANALVARHALQDYPEAIGTMSVDTTPIFHTDNWLPVRLKESERDKKGLQALKYDTAGILYDVGYDYDQTEAPNLVLFPRPAGVTHIPTLFNSIFSPSWGLSEGVDFFLLDDAIAFVSDPFQLPDTDIRNIIVDGQITDKELLVWGYRAQIDRETLYRQYGYVLQAYGKSSLQYREMLSSIFSTIIGGATLKDVKRAVSAMVGVPVVKSDNEVIELTHQASDKVTIVTDKTVYEFAPTAQVEVTVGDTVNSGDFLVDSFKIFELGRGITPDEISALAISPGILAACFYGDLVFENKEVPLTVDENHPSGYTYVSWPVGGFPADVQRFFDELHDRGVALANKPLDGCEEADTITYFTEDCDQDPIVGRKGTVAHFLDIRPNPVGEPTAASLPRTVNPLKLLVENVLRNNVYVVQIKSTDTFNGVGLQHMKLLVDVLPAHKAVLFIIKAEPQTESVASDNFTEDVSTFTAAEPVADTVAASDIVDNGARAFVVSGTCQ